MVAALCTLEPSAVGDNNMIHNKIRFLTGFSGA